MKDGRLNSASNFTLSQNAIEFPINGFTHTLWEWEGGERKVESGDGEEEREGEREREGGDGEPTVEKTTAAFWKPESR